MAKTSPCIQPFLPEGGSVRRNRTIRAHQNDDPGQAVEFNGQQEADSDESMDYRYLLVPMRFNN